MRPTTKTFFMVAVAAALTHCTKTESITAPGNVSAASPSASQGIDVRAATPQQCSAGGNVYSVFTDLNGNGQLDADEAVLTTQVVCSGANGTNGDATLFSIARVTTGYAACASGSGLQINSGLDRDHSGALEPSEVNDAQILCDGAQGATGAAGPAGSNGHNAVFQTIAAPPEICPGGGTTLLMAIDQSGSGVYSATDPDQQSMTLCNGVSAPSAYSPVEPILPCGDTVAYKEVLLRLGNGQVLGAFSADVSGLMTRLTFLPDGSFMDTDSSNCTFTLSTSTDSSSGLRTRAISWLGSVQMTWPLN